MNVEMCKYLLTGSKRDNVFRLFWTQESGRKKRSYKGFIESKVRDWELLDFRNGQSLFLPPAFRKAVKLLALTIAFTAPEASSRTIVLAGNPPASFGRVGTETTFIVVPRLLILAGMKSAL